MFKIPLPSNVATDNTTNPFICFLSSVNLAVFVTTSCSSGALFNLSTAAPESNA